MILIADISRGEDIPSTPQTLNFVEMKAKGISAVYARASDGILADLTYPIFRNNAQAAGMPFGAFGTIYPSASGRTPEQQAAAFIKYVGDDKLQLPHVVDWEVEGVTWQMVDTYLATLEAKYPIKEFMIYSRTEYMNRYLPNRILVPNKYNRFAKLGFWQAQYGVTTPSSPPSGFTRVLWQFTSKGMRSDYSTTGESVNLDLNYFDGTIDQFNARFGIGPILIPPPTDKTPKLKITINSDFSVVTEKL